MARNSSTNVVNFGSDSLPTRGDLQKSRSSTSSKSGQSTGTSSSSKREPSGMEKAAAGKLFYDLQKFVSTYREVAEAQKAREQAMDAMVKIVNQYGDATDIPKLDQNLKNVAGRFGLDTEVMSDLVKALRDNSSATSDEGTANNTAPEMSQGLKNTLSDTNTLIGAIRDGIFSPRGINSMLADSRRNQVLDILGQGQSKNQSTSTNQAKNSKPDFFETSGATKKITEEGEGNTVTDSDIVEYTYKPGDTFGQVIKNLGLQTSNGLWGPNGDVAYYTQQLAEQGAMNSRGNIPIGTTIRLIRRK